MQFDEHADQSAGELKLYCDELLSRWHSNQQELMARKTELTAMLEHSDNVTTKGKEVSQWLRKLEHLPGPNRLSGPALETLTVIAYRQPIIKADIEAIRGVSCGEMVRQLLEKGLIRISGRSELLGHPFLYSTTKLFLTTFGLSSLESLPSAGKMRGTGLPDWANPDSAATPLAAGRKKPNTSTAERSPELADSVVEANSLEPDPAGGTVDERWPADSE